MTAFREDTGTGTPGRARRRVDSLHEARELVSVGPDAWAVRWIMSTRWSLWSRWLQDRAWAVLVADDLPSADAARRLHLEVARAA